MLKEELNNDSKFMTKIFFIENYLKKKRKNNFLNNQYLKDTLRNLIINFNTSNDVGYNYIKNLELEKNDDNTIRIFLLKLHESSHIKFGCGKGDDSSPRYLLNFELETLDSQYDLITEFKKGAELQTSEKKGEDNELIYKKNIYDNWLIDDIYYLKEQYKDEKKKMDDFTKLYEKKNQKDKKTK